MTALQECTDQFAAAIEPAIPMTVSEWADQERYLSSEDSPEQGKWDTARAPYQRQAMDCLSPQSPYETTVLMWASQTGKTQGLINNFIGYIIARDPGPILVVEPRVEDAKAWSKDRLAPMLRDTPCLQNRVSDVRTKDANNTTLHKRFRGGSITMAGANSPAGLAARPIRYALLDEIDRYPASAGSEGSPISLATKRTVAFWNRKILLVSSPTTKGASAIEAAYAASDQRRYWVPCPLCGVHQVLTFRRVEWIDDAHVEDAQYRCEHCEQLIPHYRKAWMLANGEWRADNPGAKIAGFWLSQLYSFAVTWGQTASEFIQANKSPETLRVFLNTALAELWDDERQTTMTDESSLLIRREVFAADVPAGVCVLTAGVDVQDDRIEVETVGWGLGEQSWSIDYRVIPGDPSGPAPWQQLDAYLLQPWRHQSGQPLRVMAACVDSGGHFTNAVYEFCAARFGRKIYAIKGQAGSNPIWPRKPSRNTMGRHAVYLIGVDSCKATVMARLKIDEPGLPGYCHFPVTRTQEYFDQLLSEFLKTEYKAGAPVRQWVRKKGRAAEALDCRCYALAALEALKSLGMRMERAAEQMAALVVAAGPDTPATPTLPGGNVRPTFRTLFKFGGR